MVQQAPLSPPWLVHALPLLPSLSDLTSHIHPEMHACEAAPPQVIPPNQLPFSSQAHFMASIALSMAQAQGSMLSHLWLQPFSSSSCSCVGTIVITASLALLLSSAPSALHEFSLSILLNSPNIKLKSGLATQGCWLQASFLPSSCSPALPCLAATPSQAVWNSDTLESCSWLISHLMLP